MTTTRFAAPTVSEEGPGPLGMRTGALQSRTSLGPDVMRASAPSVPAAPGGGNSPSSSAPLSPDSPVHEKEQAVVQQVMRALEAAGLAFRALSVHLNYVRLQMARRLVLERHDQHRALSREIEERAEPDPTSAEATAESRQQEAREDCEEARASMVEAAARASLVCDDPHKLQVAIEEAGPSARAIAGETGMPLGDGLPAVDADLDASLHAWVPKLVVWVAPLFVGPLVGVAIGVVTGLVELEALQSPGEHQAKLLALSLLGVTAVVVLGALAENMMMTLNDHGLERSREVPASSAPGWTATVRLGSQAAALTVAVIGEVLVEAAAIVDLFAQHQAYLARTSDVMETPQMSLLVAALVGCIITLPFVMAKAALADRRWKEHLRADYLSHRRSTHRAEWLAREGATAVLAAAGHVQRHERRLAETSQALDDLRRAKDTRQLDGERLRASAQACAQAETRRHEAEKRFEARLDRIVNALAPLPRTPWWAPVLGIWWKPQVHTPPACADLEVSHVRESERSAA